MEREKSYDLVCSFNQYANEKTTDKEKYQLFFKGLIKDVPQNLVEQNIEDLGEDECEKYFGANPKTNFSFLKFWFPKFQMKIFLTLIGFTVLGINF